MKTYILKSHIISARKFVFLFVVSVFAPMNMMGRISFAYDAAGNRIKRELVITQKNIAPGKTAGVEENFYDLIGEKNVTFTSDASGIVQISISDFNDKDTGHVSVYSINGLSVLEREIIECRMNIDLSSSPQGIYILCVRINESQTTWKITKK